MKENEAPPNMSTYMFLWGLPRWLSNPPAMQEIWVWSLSQEDPLEEEMTTHSSILAWEILRTEEPGRLQSLGSQRVRHNLVTEQQCFFVLFLFFFFNRNAHFRRTLFYSYHLLIIEIYWMLFLFDVINLKGKSPVTCNSDSFLPGYWKVKPCLVFGEMNMYISGPSKKVGKAKNLSIGFCPDHWGLQSQEIWWLELELASLKPHAHPSYQVPTWKML